MGNEPLVYIVILNWNGIRDTLECLESVSAIDYGNYVVMVVDNGSEDGSPETIKTNFPHVVLVENAENLGFAEGNNVGIRHALRQGAEYILLLNNDTTVDSQILKELLLAAQKYDGNGIWGAQIYYHAEPDRVWYAGAEWRDNRFDHLRDELGRDAVRETEYVCGCAMFLSSKVIDRIKLMDSRYFLTFEETDWCFRARQQGIHSYCVGNAKVYHKISTSFGGSTSPLMLYYLTRNSLLWGERHLSRQQYFDLMGSILRSIMRKSSAPSPSKHRAVRVFDALWKHYRQEYDSPGSHALYLGLRDYFLRRFGNRSSELYLALQRDIPGH